MPHLLLLGQGAVGAQARRTSQMNSTGMSQTQNKLNSRPLSDHSICSDVRLLCERSIIRLAWVENEIRLFCMSSPLTILLASQLTCLYLAVKISIIPRGVW